MKKHITCLTLILMTFIAHGQQSQNIRGRIFDADNDQPLFGATIILVDSDPVQATSSDYVQLLFVGGEMVILRSERVYCVEIPFMFHSTGR